ncbi:endonuclease/exonuclease/phosphatase family protein [Xanthomonas translucens]|uniref:endonuclease/exonuclease/phosphatase family protein n=1 Tax=Xanthomonas campestris pv. translucens TaxID=343 RepID=UPI00083AAE2D|nr:endonuclease/exonuclease/phosphatase family protein [Xanthomonas translucens]
MTDPQTIRLLHYHITNLDSHKIKSNAAQVAGAETIFKMHEFDILSLNGIQYDFEGVPDKRFETTGQNVADLIRQWGLGLDNLFFTPSNLGMNARKNADDSYILDTYNPSAITYADHLNFGTIPGQNSTGAASKYRILERKVLSDLVWKDFNPGVDFGRFESAKGGGIPPDMKLFDKSFSDLTLDVGGKRLHVILLHAAPSHNFGNPKSINVFRNAEQLRFLEWYVSGETDHAVDLSSLAPLRQDDYYIIVGDLNVDLNSKESEGCAVLGRILKKSTAWMSPGDMTFTNEAIGFAPDPFRLVLDYILVSKNIEVVEGRVIHPDLARQELGCGQDAIEAPAGKRVVTYKDTRPGGTGLEHSALVGDEYVLFKETSYHYPIYGEFKLK